jgi:TorA maturation chaperone TorD
MTRQASPRDDGVPDEERARANLYALLGRLFYGPPDEALLEEIRGQGHDAPTDPSDAVSRAWRGLVDAAGVTQAGAVRDEYESLFGGTGKAVVTPYTSHYTTAAAPDKHLVALKQTLAGLGLVRRNTVFEVEDHAAAICDVMRVLIERDASLGEQAAFFSLFVFNGMMGIGTAIAAVATVKFYREVARLTCAFLLVEHAAFDMVNSGY